MTRTHQRLVRQFDEAHVVYRLHLRAKAVVLNQVEYELVEKLFLRRLLIGVMSALAIILGLLLSFHLYRRDVFPLAVFICLVAVLMWLATVLDEKLMVRISAILDAAPISAEDNNERVPSRLEAYRLALTSELHNASSNAIWHMIIHSALILFACLFVLAKQMQGTDPTVPDTHPVILAMGASISGLFLHIVLRERRRRSMRDPD